MPRTRASSSLSVLRRARLVAVVLAVAFGLGGAVMASVPATAVDEPIATPIERLGGCLAGGGVGDVVLLIDESSSVQDTDPDDARATSAKYFINQLGAYASENAASVNVQVATFAQTYTPITDWVALDQAGMGTVQDAVDSVAERDDGWETDYWSALNGARIALADAAASHGATASCQAIVWLSDGELWFNPVPKGDDRKGFAPDLVIRGQEAADEAWQLAKTDLCRTGGLADQLRSSGVITFGIGLDGPGIPPGGFDLMESIVAGSTASGSVDCGSIVDPVPGAFFLASDIDSLLFAFDELSTPGQPAIKQEHGICQVTVCTSEGHRVVLDSSTPRVTILATSDLPGAIVSLQAPTGEIVQIPTGAGTTQLAGAEIGYEWKSDRSVSIVIDKAASTQWRGLWQLAFTDPAGASAGQTSKSSIRVQGTLVPDWANSDDVALHAGNIVEGLQLGFRTRTGEPADPDVIEGTLVYSAVLRDSDGTPFTIISTTDPAALEVPLALDLSDAALGAGSVTLQSRITTAATTFEGEAVPGTQLEAETVTIPVTVLPPLEYPVVGSSVDFGHAESNDVELHAVLPVSGDGCIRIGDDVEVLASPADIGAVTIVADESGCLVASPDGVELTLTTAHSGNGTINGTFVVTLEPDVAGEALETTVAFTASLARPVEPLNFWLTLILALILGPGLPLGILYLMKWIVSTIPARMLYGFVVDVTVADAGILREGQSFAVRPADTASLVSVPPRARRLTVGDVRLRVRTGASPFGRGRVVVDAPGRSSISGATPAADRSGLRAVLPLAVHNNWVLLRTPGTPADRAQLLVLLGGNDGATISRFLQTLADRGPGRLRALVDAETRNGSPPPPEQGAGNPFAVTPADAAWGGGNPFEPADAWAPAPTAAPGPDPDAPSASPPPKDDQPDGEWKPWG
jgi:hypothetical protein